jgi:hypothetical protein
MPAEGLINRPIPWAGTWHVNVPAVREGGTVVFLVQEWMRATLPRLAPMVAAVGLLTTGVAAPPAAADASAPSWWLGATCDAAGNPGSYALGASYDGVVACGPGTAQGGTDVEEHFFQGAWGEYEWECVELVMRYIYLVFGIAPYSANGDTVVSNYNGNVLTQVSNNGTSLPSPGDILSWAGTNENPDGHTAIVTAVNVANGSGTITILQQNASADGWGTVSVSDNVLTTQIFGGSVTGWLHNPNAGSGLLGEHPLIGSCE